MEEIGTRKGEEKPRISISLPNKYMPMMTDNQGGVERRREKERGKTFLQGQGKQTRTRLRLDTDNAFDQK